MAFVRIQYTLKSATTLVHVTVTSHVKSWLEFGPFVRLAEKNRRYTATLVNSLYFTSERIALMSLMQIPDRLKRVVPTEKQESCASAKNTAKRGQCTECIQVI